MKAVVPALLVAALFLGACSSESKTEAKPAAKPAAKANMGMMNSKCPISGKATDPEVTADYKGGKVGFCCEGCAGKFAKMSDADKASKVSAAK